MALVVLCACALWGGTPTRAAAQDGAAEVPGYREAIDEALAEYAAQNYLEALSSFARAHKLSPSARTLRGLGSVTFELHRYSESVSYLEQALASEHKRLDAIIRAETERLLARARGYVAELALRVEPSGVRVIVDGAQVAWVAGQPLLLDIGKHQLEFRAAGCVADHRSYTVIGGEADSWHISLRQESSAPKSLVEASPPAPLLRWHKVLGAATIGLGIASLATAGVYTARRHAESNDFRAVDPMSAEY